MYRNFRQKGRSGVNAASLKVARKSLKNDRKRRIGVNAAAEIFIDKL